MFFDFDDSQRYSRPEAPDFPATLTWVNMREPPTLEALRGRVVLLYFWTPVGPWQFVPLAIAVAGLYVLLMVPVMMTPPLGPLLAARLHPWLSRLPRVARHLARPVDAPAR